MSNLTPFVLPQTTFLNLEHSIIASRFVPIDRQIFEWLSAINEYVKNTASPPSSSANHSVEASTPMKIINLLPVAVNFLFHFL